MVEQVFTDSSMLDCAHAALDELGFDGFCIVDSEEDPILHCYKDSIKVVVSELSDGELDAGASVLMGYLNQKKMTRALEFINDFSLQCPSFDARLMVDVIQKQGKSVHIAIARSRFSYHNGESVDFDMQRYIDDLQSLHAEMRSLQSAFHAIAQGGERLPTHGNGPGQMLRYRNKTNSRAIRVRLQNKTTHIRGSG